jgi:hypothetical protein
MCLANLLIIRASQIGKYVDITIIALALPTILGFITEFLAG